MLRRALIVGACALLPVLAGGPAWADAGYWIGASDGSVYGFGGAGDHGSVAGSGVEGPVVCIASTPSGGGYWEVARDGGVYTFGDAGFFGSAAGRQLNRPIVGMAATPSGGGYRLVASDGGVFTYGDAAFFGSAGGTRLNQPIVGMATTPSGEGYWLVASDGGIFTYGDAAYAGSATGGSTSDVVGVSPVGGAAGCNAGSSIMTDRMAVADAYASNRDGVTGVAVVNTATGELVGNPASDVPMRSASIVKVVIAMALFARVESEGRELTDDERAQLAAMIRESDNDAASQFWDRLGGPAVITWVRQATGVTSTQPPDAGHGWGFTMTTAHDLAVILASLVRGHAISAAHSATILDDMRHVDLGQRWGVGEAVHRSVPAVKNGWYPDTDVPFWRVHCGGVVDAPGAANRWVVVVMTRYPIGLGMGYGEDTCRDAASRVLPPDV